jgi:amino acid adenylation domain-containing protein
MSRDQHNRHSNKRAARSFVLKKMTDVNLAEYSPVNCGDPIQRQYEPMPASVLEGSIIDRFEEIVCRHSARPALSDSRSDLSYAELARIVDRIAAATTSATQRPGPVAIVLPNGAYFPAAVLGALAAGRGYVPLDASVAMERNRLIALQSGAAAVISIDELGDRIRELFPQHLPIVMVDSLRKTSKAKRARSGPEDLSCIIYTSGSTGVPKGAYHSQRSLLHIIMQITNSLHVNAEDRLINATSPSFVGATKNVLSALLNGASVHMQPPLRLAELVNEIQRRAITMLRVPPTLMRRIAEALHPQQLLDSVRLVELSAERAEWSDFDIFRQAFRPDTQLATQLTSTEGDATRWFVDPTLRAPGEPLPVGRIIPDRSLTIVDDNGRLVTDGEVGELVIKSRYVALGYWRDPEETARWFAVDPTDSEIRMYKTGDLARRRADGLFEYVGRKDDQIKLHGHRIEPAEIETTLRNCVGVRDAFIVVRKNDDGSVRSLAAYVEARSSVRDLSPRDLRSMLQSRLPPYMIPASIHLIEQLPRLPNLKIDRSRIAEIDAVRVRATLEHQSLVAPASDETALWLQALWKKLLRLDILPSFETNFFEFGGDSFASAELISAVEEKFCCELSLQEFFQSPTIATLCHLLRSARSSPSSNGAASSPKPETRLLRKIQAYTGSWKGARLFLDSLIIGRNTGGSETPLFWVFQEESEFVQLAKHLGPGRPVYGMRSCVSIVSVKDHSSDIIETVCNRYLWEILALPVKRPFIVGGNCQGGIFALALAKRLTQIGHAPSLLILLEWTYSYGRYLGPALLLYGEQSYTADIYRTSRKCTPNWREDFPCNTAAGITGAHGHFFEDTNIGSLARAIRTGDPDERANVC